MDKTFTRDVESIPLDVVQGTLWHFGDYGLGVQPGMFDERLLLTISAADRTNRTLLSTLFPHHFRAFDLASSQDGGLEALRDRVKRAIAWKAAIA